MAQASLRIQTGQFLSVFSHETAQINLPDLFSRLVCLDPCFRRGHCVL